MFRMDALEISSVGKDPHCLKPLHDGFLRQMTTHSDPLEYDEFVAGWEKLDSLSKQGIASLCQRTEDMREEAKQQVTEVVNYYSETP